MTTPDGCADRCGGKQEAMRDVNNQEQSGNEEDMYRKAYATRRSVVGQGRRARVGRRRSRLDNSKETDGENDVEGGSFATAESLKLMGGSAADELFQDKVGRGYDGALNDTPWTTPRMPSNTEQHG